MISLRSVTQMDRICSRESESRVSGMTRTPRTSESRQVKRMWTQISGEIILSALFSG